jgi:hypothetical protein
VGGEGSLGNNTKSRAIKYVPFGDNNEQIQGFTLDPVRREYVEFIAPKDAVSNARRARFELQGASVKLLFNHETPRKTQWRVTGCTRRKISEHVAILHSVAISKAHFGGLMVCGSVWTCPPCAAKISERRKIEIKQATDTFRSAGGALYMITHTFSHAREDLLGPLLKRFSKARQYMRSQRAYKDLRVQLGYIGDIRALEVTHGAANGFHPHEHDLWLTAKPLTRVQLRSMMDTLFRLWSRACLVAGLSAPNRKRGVNIKYMESAAEYMAKFGREPKWGVASELSKQYVKKGREKSKTPFDLLSAYHEGDTKSGPLFIQFAKAFFGKRQIIWSDGLRALFGIEEKTDEEIALEQDEEAKLLIRVDAREWRLILRQGFDVRSLLLDLAENGGYEAVRTYLDNLILDGAPC